MRHLGTIALSALLAGGGVAQADSHSAPLSPDTHSSDIVRFSKECEDWDEWDKPAPPFKVYGNTFYVGTCGISAILIRGGYAHILIDTGTREGAEAVLANMRALGMSLDVGGANVEIILHSHEHFDHVGGMLFIARETGARVHASKPAADALYTGNVGPDDPQFGIHDPMEKITAWRFVRGGEDVVLGNLKLTPVATPGHTPGALTWQWESCQNDICKTIVYADSLSAISRDDYKFSDHPDYVAAFRAGIERLRALDCDILLTPHPSASNMIERAATGTFEGGMTCAQYADGKMQALDDRLAKEAASE